jgi:hypothetical protein
MRSNHPSNPLPIAIAFTLMTVQGMLFVPSGFSTTLQSRTNLQLIDSQLTALNPKKRPRTIPKTKRPRDPRIAGGSRGQCPSVDVGLTAIVPLAEAETGSDRPTFWFYSPYKDVNLSAKFTIQQNGKPIAEPLTIPLPKTPGLLRVSLPEATSLQANQSYQWFLSIDCNASQPNAKNAQQPPIELEGRIRRVTLSIPSREKLSKLRAHSREQTEFYITNDLWLEAITTTIDRRQSMEWETLMRSLNLNELEKMSLLSPSP